MIRQVQIFNSNQIIMNTRINNKWLAVALVTAFFAFGPIQNGESNDKIDGKSNREKIAKNEAKPVAAANRAEVKKSSTTRQIDHDYWIAWKRQIIWPISGNGSTLLPARPGC
jgi:hypothetical protein